MIFPSEKTNPVKRLLLLSDLWGWQSVSWLVPYLNMLSPQYSIAVCDSRAIAEIDSYDISEKEVHSQFVNGGIDKAVQFLLENHQEESLDILAFSVGATIGWKAMLAGLKVERFYGVSGTRLRYETEKPDAVIELLYGEEDEYKPKEDWFEKQNIKAQILKSKGHELYKEQEVIEVICKRFC